MDTTLGFSSRSQVFGGSVQGDQRWFSWSRAWRCHPSSDRTRVPHPTPFAGSERYRAGRARKTAWTPCRAAYEPYPFSETDYYRASLQLVQIADVPGASTGHLLLMREGPRGIVDVERGLVLSVAGDTLAGIASLMQGRPGDRPLSLDLLWSVLERGRELSRKDWRLQRVAIVALRGDAYIGRAFFGDASGQTAWDCDCRPSDGCWLSLKARCPIFVHHRVWEENASPLKELARQDNPLLGSGATSKGKEKKSATAQPLEGVPITDSSPAAQFTGIRPSDPEVLRRLKMEMRVALKDEDYATAKRLRDHPFMRLHTKIVDAEKTGDLMAAQKLQDELSFRVAAYEQTGIVMDEDEGEPECSSTPES